ncbi:MAG: efflux RND transporter periplasmic adaptor subunit [Bacteroidetes bacterium]|nr:efflux RND transporter periplasmic adaptor subunit [Bacteroidota bacterium]
MMKKSIIILQVIFIWACSSEPNMEVSPTRRDITEYVFATGTVQPDQHYNLVAQVDGYLIKVNFKENDIVKTAQLLAIIDNQGNLINTENANQQLHIANQNLSPNAPALKQLATNIDFAEKKYQQDLKQQERYKTLLESNSIARIEYENAELTSQNSLSNLNALKEQYRNLKLQAQQQMLVQKNNFQLSNSSKTYNQVRALGSGKVLKRYKQMGDFVRKGDIIARIGNLEYIVAQINVDESNIAKIKVGQIVLIRLNTHPNDTFEAKVAEIFPTFDDTSQSFIVNAEFIKVPDFNIVGTQLEANIEIAQRQNVLVIPREYMGFGNKIQLKGKKESKAIKTGIISSEYVEVLTGLSEKDILVPLKP